MITLIVNGKQHRLDIAPDTPVLWAVRDHLKLLGSKFGCGTGLCGACTMHVDGKAIRSCITPVESVENQEITTIEGLNLSGQLHPVQQAWLDHDVPQCGYCQPGQIMSAAALLNTTQKPNDDDIDSAMSGNICRCGTYIKIRQAIHTASRVIASSTDPISEDSSTT